MNGRFFLDTNIFVYSFDASSPKKAAQARKLIRSAIETGGGIVSYQAVQEFFNMALRRFSKPMKWCRRRTIFVDHVSSTPVSPLLASFVWRGVTDWSQVPVALVRFVDRRFRNRRSVWSSLR
jgi:predicted nucleic acid-binding protein